MQRSRSILCTVLLLAACERGQETLVNPLYTLCKMSPGDERCAPILTEWCAEHPEDPEWCSDASTPDSGMDGTVPADATADTGDAECRDCSVSGCSSNNECSANAANKFCSPAKQCVQCLENAQCGATDPVCNGNKCTGCTSKADCTARADAPACESTSGDCVECTTTDPAKCTAANKVCKTGANSCVECNTSADCKDPTKPTCEANVCRACANDNDCSGKMSGGVALDACLSGQCVDCRVDATDTKKDYGCAGTLACNPTTRACSDRMKNSASTCSACLSDAECIADHRCVEMTYLGTALQPGGQSGGYCLPLISAPGDCPIPYRATPVVRGSRSGAASDSFCGVNENKTTCEAIRAFGKGCSSGGVSACGATGARCENVNGSSLCTYSCGSGASDECPENRGCPAGSNSYCGQM